MSMTDERKKAKKLEGDTRDSEDEIRDGKENPTDIGPGVTERYNDA